MADFLLAEDGPRNIAGFEVWCRAARRRLHQLAKHDDELGKADCQRHAADLVARAGDFGLTFPHTLCRPREKMALAEAIKSIEACLNWCSRNLVVDEAGLEAFAARLDANFAGIRANLALLTQQKTVKDHESHLGAP